MARIHVNLQVGNLDESLAFYNRLFGAPPTVRKSDYAKWMLEDPRINFSIATTSGEPRIEHLGIQAESREELAVLRGRLSQDDPAIDHEGETVCCYARSDKTWITDAQDVSWELFYTHGSADSNHGEAEGGRAAGGDACCATGCCETDAASEPTAEASQCC